MVDHATAKYLNDNVGTILAKALAEMSVAQPLDGVDFLAQWLKTYAEQEEAKAWREKEEKTLEEERTKTKAKLDEKEARKKERVAEKQETEDVYQKFIKKLEDENTTFDFKFWSELVSVVRTITLQTSVYIGILDKDVDGVEGGSCICYTAASEGSEWMTEKILPKDVGVTWGALVENPGEEAFQQYPLWKPPSAEAAPPEPVDGEDPPAEVPTFYCPVNVECVTDVTAVHYFDMTRLGAYVAVPMVYTSYYTKESLDAARQFEEEQKAARAKAREEAAELAAQAATEDTGDETNEALDAALQAIDEKKPVLKGQEVKMVLCMDTLGTNTNIEEAKIIKVIELCKACGNCKSRTEAIQIDQQAIMAINDERRQKLDEQIAEVREEATASVDQETAQPTEEDEDNLYEKKKAYFVARKTVLGLKDVILELKSWEWVPPEMMSILAAIGFMFGFKKEDIYPKKKSVINWDKLKTLLDGELFTSIGNIDISGERKNLTPEQKLNSIKQLGLPDGVDEEAAKTVWPAFQILFVLLQTAVAYRTADLDLRKARYMKQTEEGEAPPTQKLEELDDDFAEP